MKKTSIFVTGTDTGVGKTVVTGLLARFLSENGLRTVTQKWIQTGCKGFSEDVAVHLKLMGKTEKDFEGYIPYLAPYTFPFPSSPHLAAQLEGETIDTGKILDSFYILRNDFDVVVVEGAGGPVVPVDNEKMIIDICERARIPALIVAENRLGAINQVVLTVEALKKRNVTLLGVVFNQISKGEDKLVLEDNPVIVSKLTGMEVLGSLPYHEDTDVLYGMFAPIGRRILPVVARSGEVIHKSPPGLSPGDLARTMDKNELIKKDRDYIWHPYTQMKDCDRFPPIPIAKAKGVKLYDFDGNFYYDTISSWWCNVHGHGHPAIINAVKKQLDSLEHVLFAGFTHAPAAELSEKLVGITPPGLTKVFFSDNGSTAVEVALKMSFRYWKNIGKKGREKFLSLDMAYHGDTVGAMSVSGVSLFNRPFEPLFFEAYKVPAPYCYRCPVLRTKENCSIDCLVEAEKMLEKHSGEIAAIIIEPLLLGAGGMIVYPVEYLKGMEELSRKYNVHLIADEVATGFGRTGKMFACERAGVNPDFMCLSKGITSGYLPLAATLTTREIYDTFYADYEKLKTFYHGHTYTANPVACAAANASIGLFDEENTLEKVPEINRKLEAFLKEISRLSMVGDTRSIGVAGAIELVKDKNTRGPFDLKKRVGLEIYKRGLEKNLLLRPLGDIVYFFLPLCVTHAELGDIFSRAHEVFSSFQMTGFPVE